uniref:Uncharacterized protein n=1 Tax=Zea mays TaxID=4577 RepID=B6TVS6_MAIZE|nr:hypothetical protein [Zea mays]
MAYRADDDYDYLFKVVAATAAAAAAGGTDVWAHPGFGRVILSIYSIVLPFASVTVLVSVLPLD